MTCVTGTISEMVAAVDLMRRGWQVFRAMNPGAPCDLVAISGSRILRVQVRTAGRNTSGNLYLPRMKKDAGRQDHYAFIVDGSTVIYEPDLPEISNGP